MFSTARVRTFCCQMTLNMSGRYLDALIEPLSSRQPGGPVCVTTFLDCWPQPHVVPELVAVILHVPPGSQYLLVR
jgi:hypothetical protein